MAKHLARGSKQKKVVFIIQYPKLLEKYNRGVFGFVSVFLIIAQNCEQGKYLQITDII